MAEARGFPGAFLMSAAAGFLGRYLTLIGMSQPADAVQQYQLTMLRQWVDHLDAVLEDEQVEPGLRQRIIQGVIYGSVPTAAEAALREQVATEMVALAERSTQRR